MSDNTIEKEAPNAAYAPNTNGSVRHADMTPPEGFMIHPGQIRPFEHRKLANPAPLGLSAFALTTFVLSCINLHTRDITTPNIAVPLAFGYGGLVQLLAGMWEMAVGNTFGATALSSYGGFWLAYGTLFHPYFDIFNSIHSTADGEPAVVYSPEARYSAVGFFLTGWFIFTLLLLLCTLKSTVMFFLLFFTLDLAFLFLACENYAASMGKTTAQVGLQKAGGVMGMLAAFLAWYNALAGIQDNGNSFFKVPVFPLPWSEAAKAARATKAAHSV